MGGCLLFFNTVGLYYYRKYKVCRFKEEIKEAVREALHDRRS